ncbi:glycoside hydrolase family 97 protein [Shewanella kaireitica]|uniref:glycoside hydrolase family 97 protein n=1 Tax=Shewanella kaireitica TaxID=212021 RepID=UPI00200F922B|nr:glycoside hydrolase family 97 protein [Shewanella kaireitica]MCL1096124.1 glycoside hydrolase family 97 protein [Shewanella kaireitica]
MKKTIATLCCVVASVCCSSVSALEDVHKLASPNGQITLEISSGKTFVYSVSIAGKPVLKDAIAALEFSGGDSKVNGINVYNVSGTTVDRTLMPHVQQKSQHIKEHYNQITLAFNQNWQLTFRLFDQGLGYRFSTTSGGDVTVISETAEFNFGQNLDVLFPEEKSFVSHNERLYLPMQLNAIEPSQFASLPLLVDGGDFKLVISETGLKDYPGMWLRGDSSNILKGIFPKYVVKAELKEKSDRNENILQRAAFNAKNVKLTQGVGRHYPWRMFAIAQNDAELLTNELSYLLADDLAIDPSWIKPGQVAWDWWNANNIHGVDFKAGINTETYKYYIDFAAKYGIEYIVLDEGWHHLDSVLNVVDDIDVEAIIDYGKSKNVDVILWVIWKTLDNELTLALDTFEQWGAAGIKVDFMQRDDQAMVNYYWKIAEESANRQLLVDFHGSYKPAGLRRAYPNVITREGVRGLEHNKWADYITAEHNLTLPFIRQVAGPMDYTPGAMVNSQPDNFRIVFNRPMSKTTRAHQIAMYVVYESPLQMLADSPSNYLNEHESTVFISQIPTVWDETIVISAKLSDHIITARRSGKEWFIAAMGNGEARKFNIDLPFLEPGMYQLKSIADGLNADKYASDYQVASMVVSKSTKLNLVLAPSGGWVGHLVPIKK